ncbi:CHASE2 domain-containing protein [filamentous cyanobacterium LEGE 11480]|uniref:CHASE2 domain-containing protein n=1 Tax=Romeriopsis navalis LEGE 11480 TaxID=2777977 RepID=A0A928VR25_9CYAN|nr:CHAT domain-containing protein [Romeriopsis navalis]MBE9032940.1 CHASE2 domain-containing protein [Romeriopsis navalis LEGE 11480]
MSTKRVFLRVSQVGQTCLFQLDMGSGQSLQQSIQYPASLEHLYKNWRGLYRQFYANLSMEIRGRPVHSGVGNLPPEDQRMKLAQAEVLLLNEFYGWLSDGALLPIRRQLAKLAQSNGGEAVNLFLSCNHITLDRLPWEAWDIGQEFGAAQSIRITRSPINIRYELCTKRRRGKIRILAIMGDNTGLDFKAEYAALEKLRTTQVADVKFIGQQKRQLSSHTLKGKIIQALEDDLGWDILFFAGHSNETELSQGEISIAPQESILLSELRPFLKKAQQQGLRVGIFNSCLGLNIGEGLVDLGLGQVVVMRELIHNQVAQEFFLRLVKQLSQYEDIHTAVRSACQYLQSKRQLTFPSAYLVPSVYCHPDAPFFQAQPVGIRAKFQQWLPNRWEAVGLIGLALFSTSLNVQQHLIKQRQWVQAIYRDATGQMPKAQPPVLLVQIDPDSIDKNKIEKLRPIDKNYIGKLLSKAKQIKAPVVGLDYLLDRPQGQADEQFSQLVRRLTKKNFSLSVAVTCKEKTCQGPLKGLFPEQVVNFGSMDLMRIPGRSSIYIPEPFLTPDFLPLSYHLACNHFAQKNHANSEDIALSLPRCPTPQKLAKPNSQKTNSPDGLSIPTTKLISYRVGQMWLHPVIDYSLHPKVVYQTLPAWKFLELSPNSPKLKRLPQQILLIAPGLYDEAGVKYENEDHYAAPQAFQYWQESGSKMSGGQVHAYLTHHWLKDSMIVPIPDLWMIGVAAIFAKGVIIYRPKWLMKWRDWYLSLAILGFLSLINLQIYISFQILLPLILPTTIVGLYLFLNILRKLGYAK